MPKPSTEYSSSGSEYTPSDEYEEAYFEPDSSGMSGEDSDISGEDLDVFGGPLDYNIAGKELQVEEIEDRVRRFEESGSDMSSDEFDDDLDKLYHGNKHPPEFYRRGIENMNEDKYTRKVYAKGTMKLIRNSENHWKLYCRTVLQEEDWIKSFSRVNFKVVYQFLQWYLAQRTNKNGGTKRRVKARQSLVTFWCCFRLAYQRATNLKIDTVVDRGLMHNGLVELSKSLEHNVRPNRSMTIDDLKLYINTTLCTTEKSFKMGELRILAVLFLLLLAPQGSRPGCMLELKFKHIKILLIRDPNNPEGRPRLVTKLSLQFTKTYLGEKATKSFTVPEIMYDPSLLLSPHVFLLAIIFRYKAFNSPSLNENPHELGQLRIHRGENEMYLSFRPEILNMYIFRKPIKTSSGYRMGTERLSQGTMSKWISTMGMLSGFEHSTMAYNLRYMAGNSLDRDANISSALRDLVMDHAPNSNTFQKHCWKVRGSYAHTLALAYK
ncbi:hypothetical protein INS49_014038 [Diaporthe citri]|uniref:uncharacterized protein n=1 Tax=Diaporthe citri TaxID=83186 RepID=UPI001C8111E9|nr:uncharacterized protein INS49_014038 [Diaporthe citri]KAG6358154.1 hypothetical protein INS49_014038 [Diaporthe citri]